MSIRAGTQAEPRCFTPDSFPVVRRRLNVRLCATGVRLRSPALVDFTGITSRSHWQHKAVSGTHIFSGDAARVPASVPTGAVIRGAMAAFAFVMLFLQGCGKGIDSNSTATNVPPAATKLDVEPQIRRFCGDCHAFPPPESFPRNNWAEEVNKGFSFFYDSSRPDRDVPPLQATIDYFQARAPKRLPLPVIANHAPTSDRPEFERLDLLSAEAHLAPAVAHMALLTAGFAKQPGLIVSDMRSGEVRLWETGGPATASMELARLSHPAHAVTTDLDGDGINELVVSDLGSFLPDDHLLGKVWWLRPQADGAPWQTVEISTGLSRVSDVEPADIDGDGDTDLVVAEFGWRKSGRILLLRNQGMKDNVPMMEVEVLDKRHGTIHVPVTDLNGDGRPDFVALISQEHEVIEAFLNRGNGEWERQPIYAALDPSFGSSGIELVDLDADGDLDVLYTNGDSFDSALIKPYHGVRWLENKGTYPFTVHHITAFPGAHRALAADLDGDGDLDVVAVSLLPGPLSDLKQPADITGVIWLEQVGKDATSGEIQFLLHRIEGATCNHATCALLDWNGDGAIDILAGNYDWHSTEQPSITVYLNRLTQRREPQ